MSFFFAAPPPLNPPARRTAGRRRRVSKPLNRRRRRRFSDSEPVLRRLQALKELIPSVRNRTAGEEAAPPAAAAEADRIFEDAAGYILRLKLQVEILKRLVDFYGAKEEADGFEL